MYAAAAGMAAQQVRIDMISNSLANSGTFGYKAERIGVRDLLYSSENGVAVGSGAAAVDAGRSSAQGALGDSSDPLALAIEGPGYFRIKRADGSPALTRNGSFQMDSKGALVTASGEQLIPPIRVPRGTQPEDITVGTDGKVILKGKTIGTIGLFNVPAPSELVAVGNSSFAVSKGSGAAVAAPKATQILQSQVEQSNIDIASTMTDMLDAQNTYTMVSRALTTQDQLAQIANQLKR
jgi:flagellar basal-body rod protein FlgG